MYILSALSAICPQLANRVQKCARSLVTATYYIVYSRFCLEFCRRPYSVLSVQNEGERRAAIEQLPRFWVMHNLLGVVQWFPTLRHHERRTYNFL